MGAVGRDIVGQPDREPLDQCGDEHEGGDTQRNTGDQQHCLRGVGQKIAAGNGKREHEAGAPISKRRAAAAPGPPAPFRQE